MKNPFRSMSGGYQKGMGLVEALLAMMVLTGSIAAVVIVIFGNQSIRLDNEVNNEALYRAAQALEESKLLSAKSFSSVIPVSTPANGSDIFGEALSVKDISPCRKDVKSRIDWSVQPGRLQNVSLTTSLVSIKEAASLGNDCLVVVPKTGWRNPQTYNGADLYPGGNAGTDIDVFTVDGKKYAVLSSHHSASTSHDIWVYNITDLKKTDVIAPLSSIDTGYGLYSLDIAKNTASGRYFAYAVGKPGIKDSEQLKVIDMFNIANPVVVSEINIPGGFNGREVYFYRNRIYVGEEGGGLYIYDVANPYAPAYIGSFQLGRSLRDIIIREEMINGNLRTIAYLAASVSSANQPELVILDVTDPGGILLRGAFNAPGTQNGTAIYILGSRLYLGRGYGAGNELYLLDVSNHNAIGVLGSARLDLGPSGSEVSSIIVSGELIFLGTSDSNQEFQVWNTANQANIFWWSHFNFPAGITGMDFDGTYMYLSVNSNDGFRILYDAP